MGSEPVDRTKRSGTVEDDSLNERSRSKSGGSINFCPIVAEMKSDICTHIQAEFMN